jgi:hypothetical protein
MIRHRIKASAKVEREYDANLAADKLIRENKLIIQKPGYMGRIGKAIKGNQQIRVE